MPNSFSFKHFDYIRRTIQIRKFLIVKLFPFPIRIPLDYMPCPPQSSNFKPLDYIRRAVQISKVFIVKLFPFSFLLATCPAHLNLLALSTLPTLGERYRL